MSSFLGPHDNNHNDPYANSYTDHNSYQETGDHHKMEISDREIMSTNSSGEQGSNRKKMAWVSLVAMLLVIGALMFAVPVEKIAVMDGILGAFFFAMASVVGAYMGFTTLAFIKGKK